MKMHRVHSFCLWRRKMLLFRKRLFRQWQSIQIYRYLSTWGNSTFIRHTWAFRKPSPQIQLWLKVKSKRSSWCSMNFILLRRRPKKRNGTSFSLRVTTDDFAQSSICRRDTYWKMPSLSCNERRKREWCRDTCWRLLCWTASFPGPKSVTACCPKRDWTNLTDLSKKERPKLNHKERSWRPTRHGERQPALDVADLEVWPVLISLEEVGDEVWSFGDRNWWL